MSDSRSGHDLGRGVARPVDARQMDDEGAASAGNPGEEGTGRTQGRQQRQQDAEDRGRAIAEARNAAGRGISAGAFSGTAQPAVVQEANEAAAPESNEPFSWTGTWDEAAAERNRLRSAGEDTSEIQAWLNANEPAEQREERLSAQQPADEIEPTENEDPADTQIAQELVEDLPGNEDPDDPDDPGDPGDPGDPKEPPASGLDVRLEDSIRRVLGMDGGKGSAAIGTLALVIHSIQEGLARGMKGEPVGIPSILEMALEDYRARRDHLDLRPTEAILTETGAGGAAVTNAIAQATGIDGTVGETAHQRNLEELRANQDFQRELVKRNENFAVRLREIDFDNAVSVQRLGADIEQEMLRLQQTIGLENFDVTQRMAWDQALREAREMSENPNVFARAARAGSGVDPSQNVFNNIMSGLGAAGKIFGAILP